MFYVLHPAKSAESDEARRAKSERIYDERMFWRGFFSQRKKYLLASSVERIKRDFAGTTCATRAMNTHVGVNDGLVSNDSDSEIRESNAQGAELDLIVRTFSWSEFYVGKLSLIHI